MDSNDENNFYENYEKDLTLLIYEKSNGEIPKHICSNLAKNAASRMKYDMAQGVTKDISEYAGASIWAYFQ